MSIDTTVLRIAVPSPLPHTLDYLPPSHADTATLIPGMRLRVPLGRAQTVGVLMEIGKGARIDGTRMRAAGQPLDASPLLPDDLLALANWAAGYYHHPIGEVVCAMLPVLLRQGRAADRQGESVWRLTAQGAGQCSETMKRAPRQASCLAVLLGHPAGLTATELSEACGDVAAPLRALRDKGWIERVTLRRAPPTPTTPEPSPVLNPEQQQAVTAVHAALDGFQPFLLDGVTGSGKTEVYLRLINEVIARGGQALVLVPEIALTPQLVGRFRARLAAPIAVLHSGLGDGERLEAWLQARDGSAAVVIGTRSAVFTPLKTPALIIVDEEHDLSYKQQEGFRYGARDVAVMRARLLNVPILLGSATPSLESLYNAEQGRYQPLMLTQRAGGALAPHIEVLDVRKRVLEDGLSAALLERIRTHLDGNGQVLVFLNRRGYAPTLMCHDCGWVGSCRRCDARLVIHRAKGQLRCHHCGAQERLPSHCPQCDSGTLVALGQGTERIETVLERYFPRVGRVRIDRDSTRRRGALEDLLEQVHDGRSRLLIGTQLIAKGHHFPDVTLVAVLDADHGLFGADFRAGERMAQMIVQVAGRAGRAERPGEVVIQTHHPDHPMLAHLIREGYASFARDALAERQAAGLPPYTAMAMLRAEAATEAPPLAFLTEVRELAASRNPQGAVAVYGPVPAPMPKRAGKHRAQLLLQADRRAALQRLLEGLAPQLGGLKGARKVRWSLDVDPLETL